VPVQAPAAYHPTFATWAAVTELRIDEGSASPAAYYGTNGLTIARYRSPREAAIARDTVLVVQFVMVGHGSPRFTVEWHGNLVLVVSGRRRAVEAAVALLP
jgi:hypothetical protein